MPRKMRTHTSRAKVQPVDPILQLLQLTNEAPAPYPDRNRKLTRENRKSRQTITDLPNISNVQIKRTTGGSGSQGLSLKLTFGSGLIGSLPEQKQPQPSDSDELTDYILPMMMMAAKKGFNSTGADPPKPRKTKSKKTPKEDDPFEAYAEKLWESMSKGLNCSCRKRKLLEALQKDRERLEQNELHLRAQIGSYKMYEGVMSNELQKQDVGVVLVPAEESSECDSKLKYKLEKKTPENCADMEALAVLMQQLKAYF